MREHIDANFRSPKLRATCSARQPEELESALGQEMSPKARLADFVNVLWTPRKAAVLQRIKSLWLCARGDKCWTTTSSKAQGGSRHLHPPFVVGKPPLTVLHELIKVISSVARIVYGHRLSLLLYIAQGLLCTHLRAHA
eukprot:scaffold140335_cov30-Tisochrysis_lutea.AAC.3